MNKLVKLLSICALSASVTLWSCKGDQGETGPQGATGLQGTPGTNGTAGTNGTNGTNGTSGKDGNANVVGIQSTVKVDDWKEVEVPGIGSGETSKYGAVSIPNAAITTEKFVMVFLKNGEELKALPLTFTKDLDNSLERLDYGYRTGSATLYYRFQTKLFDGTIRLKPTRDLTFNIVITTKTVGAALENSGVNMKNYEDVMDFINASN